MDEQGKKVALSVLKNLMDEMDGMQGMKVMMIGKKKSDMEMKDDEHEDMPMKPIMKGGRSLRELLS